MVSRIVSLLLGKLLTSIKEHPSVIFLGKVHITFVLQLTFNSRGSVMNEYVLSNNNTGCVHLLGRCDSLSQRILIIPFIDLTSAVD